MAPPATRWGILGTGRICEDFVWALKTLPAEDHQVVAVAGRSKQKSEEFAAQNGIGLAVGSYEELVNLDNLDVIYVGTLNHVHKENVLLAIRAGKNVICEKPLAVNSKEISEMIVEARKHNVFLMEAYWTKFFPSYNRLKQMLKDKELGEVRTVVVQYGWPAGDDQMLDGDRGGGALLSIGCYTVMFANLVFGGEEPTHITSSAVLSKGVDRSVSLTLHYTGNRIAQLFFTTTQEVPNNAIVTGTKGTVQLPEHFVGPTRLINAKGVVEEYPLPKTDRKFNYINCVGLCYEAEAVRQCLLKGLKESPEMPLSESAHLAKLFDQIRAQIGVRYKQDD